MFLEVFLLSGWLLPGQRGLHAEGRRAAVGGTARPPANVSWSRHTRLNFKCGVNRREVTHTGGHGQSKRGLGLGRVRVSCGKVIRSYLVKKGLGKLFYADSSHLS